MPLLADDTLDPSTTRSKFGFTHVPLDSLTGTQYVLVRLSYDTSGSTSGFTAQTLKLIRTVVEGLRLNPATLDTVLLSICEFNSSLSEVHGFVPVRSIDPAHYQEPVAGGCTVLYDSMLSSWEALATLGKDMVQQDFDVALVNIHITDGIDVGSRYLPRNSADLKATLIRQEQYSTVTSVLLGINVEDAEVKRFLSDLKSTGAFDHYESVDDASPESISKLVGIIVSTSVSASQSFGQTNAQTTF